MRGSLYKLCVGIGLPSSPHPIATLFFFTDPSTTAIYTLSLHDALPISGGPPPAFLRLRGACAFGPATKSSCPPRGRSEEHTSELQSHSDLVCRLLLEKKKLGLICMTQFRSRPSSSPTGLACVVSSPRAG